MSAPTDAPIDATLAALRALHLAVEQDPPAGGVPGGNWRWQLRQRVVALRDALASDGADDPWSAARSGAVMRERNRLLTRLAQVGPQVLDTDLDALRTDLRRLVVDVHHHVQRRHDLAYDDVAQELGGSE